VVIKVISPVGRLAVEDWCEREGDCEHIGAARAWQARRMNFDPSVRHIELRCNAGASPLLLASNRVRIERLAWYDGELRRLRLRSGMNVSSHYRNTAIV